MQKAPNDRSGRCLISELTTLIAAAFAFIPAARNAGIQECFVGREVVICSHGVPLGKWMVCHDQVLQEPPCHLTSLCVVAAATGVPSTCLKRGTGQPSFRHVSNQNADSQHLVRPSCLGHWDGFRLSSQYTAVNCRGQLWKQWSRSWLRLRNSSLPSLWIAVHSVEISSTNLLFWIYRFGRTFKDYGGPLNDEGALLKSAKPASAPCGGWVNRQLHCIVVTSYT